MPKKLCASPLKMCIQGNQCDPNSLRFFLEHQSDSPFSISPIYGTFSALCLRMERESKTDYELLLWSKALQMEGVILPLIDSLKASVELLVKAGSALPEDSGADRALERFRRVIAAGEKAAEGLGIDHS